MRREAENTVLRAEGGHCSRTPGWLPAFWDVNRMQPTMKIAMTREELKRPRLSPPWANGFVTRSPIVAPSGRVRMNANTSQ